MAQAQVVRISMKRQTPAGIVCSSHRSIVISGDCLANDELGQLENALCELRMLYADQPFNKTQCDFIREACDRLFPGRWAFVSQGGTVEF